MKGEILFALALGAAAGAALPAEASPSTALVCTVTGGASALRASFHDSFCAAARAALSERFGTVVLTDEAALAAGATEKSFIRLDAHIRKASSVYGTAAWGTVRDGRLEIGGRSERLDADSMDRDLNPGTAQLLAQSLVRLVPAGAGSNGR